MSRQFPPEIETEILLRLPAKTLQRFKSVCKSWNSLISSDPNFISSFNQHSSRNPKLLFLKHPLQSPTPIHFSVASYSSESIIETTLLPLPNVVVSGKSQIFGYELKPTRIDLINSNPIDGVLGIVVYMGVCNGPVVSCDMYMWNPSTGETVRLPESRVTGLFNGPPMVKFYSGFGYDKREENYKVVRVVYVGQVNAKCEVYSLRKNRWDAMSSGSGISSNTFWASDMCTYIDGVGYWGVYMRESKDEFIVLGFKFCDEVFKKIKVPELCVDGRENKFHSLWDYRGSVALSVLHFGGFDSGSSRHYIWVSRQYKLDERVRHSWHNLFNIDLECGPRRPVVFLRTGKVVMLGDDDGEHVLYDPACGQVKSLRITDVDHVVLYAESLLSPSRFLPEETQTKTSVVGQAYNDVDERLELCPRTWTDL